MLHVDFAVVQQRCAGDTSSEDQFLRASITTTTTKSIERTTSDRETVDSGAFCAGSSSTNTDDSTTTLVRRIFRIDLQLALRDILGGITSFGGTNTLGGYLDGVSFAVKDDIALIEPNTC